MSNKPPAIALVLRDFSKQYSGATAALLWGAANEIDDGLNRETALRTEIERLAKQRDALANVANRLLTDLENVVEGLDPEEAQQIAVMRTILNANCA